MRGRDRHALDRTAIALAISLVVHALLLVALSRLDLAARSAPAAAPPAPTRFVGVVSPEQVKRRALKRKPLTDRERLARKERPKPEEKKKEPERPDGQIVQIPPPPRQERPEDATLLSEYDSKVDKQQVSREKQPPKPRQVKADRQISSTGDDPNGSADAREERRQRPQTASRVKGEGDKENPSPVDGPDLPGDPTEKKVAMLDQPQLPEGGGAFRRRPEKSADRAVRPGGGGRLGGQPEQDTWRALLPNQGFEEQARSDGSIDHLEDIDEGDATFLNTREWKHAWFFNRVKEAVQQRWHAVRAHRHHDPYGRIYGVRDRYTVLDVTLNGDGSLRDVVVIRDSGVAFLDDAAVAAFREAQPFPNPPLALQDSDGHIRFHFGFFLEISGRAGFRPIF